MTRLGSLPPLSAEVDASRYEIERKLGEGGTGAVYLARDRETGERVALKKLFRMDAKAVLRLKREFRSLMDVAHPHIVKLYDMGRTNDGWFLTMEYLEGVDLTAYVTAPESATRSSMKELTPEAIERDNLRLMSAFLQLARGIHALHHAGMLHRDLKPSNVLVVNDRVVVLDFGLVRELHGQAATVTEDGSIAGTPAYMAPEQLRGAELGTACDWYAFGVILYEALSGELPFDGPIMTILRGKLDSDPLPVQERAPAVPGWLNELCVALLQRDPAARPSGDTVIAAFDRACRVLGGDTLPTGTDNIIPTENETRSPTLYGRHVEVRKLWQALHDAERGQAAVAHVRGPSGTGKSALVEHFLDELEARSGAEALVLRSRCYELEQMPFKALDAVLDALVRHLMHLADLEVAQVLPHDIAALTQLFPVLERLHAVKQLSAGAKPIHDAMNGRQRAELALRHLLDRLAARQPIVLWIDDLHWGDLDSAQILRSWMHDAPQAPILFVFSYRSDEVTTSSCLARLLTRDHENATRPAPEHVIDIAELSPADIEALCEQRLGSLPNADRALVARIVQEAQGSPFLALQLTALAEARLALGESDASAMSIDAMVAQTGAMLPEDAKRLLAFLAVAGRPMLPKLVLHTAGIRANGRAMVHALRGLNLVRTRDVSGTRMLEIYHDRVRESVQATLSAAQSTAIHRALLDALAFSGQAEPDWLHTLALGAGDAAQALAHGRAAAERASASLAFERAAELYQRCLELAPAEQKADLWSKLAISLVRCGRGAKAADAYLEAAKGVPPEQALDLTQLAASHLLRSGRFEEGEKLVKHVLDAMGTPIPESETAVIAAIVWEQTRLKFRGLDFTPRSASSAPADLVRKNLMFEALSVAMQQYDPLRATVLQLRGLRCALDAGEPVAISRALCVAAIRVSGSGSSDAVRESDALLARANAIADRLSESAHGLVCSSRAIVEFNLGRLENVLEPSLEADRILRANAQGDPNGDYYRRFVLAAVRIATRFYVGQLREACAEVRELLREAAATDNKSLTLYLTYNHTMTDLIEGRASNVRARLDEEANQLPADRFGVLHALYVSAVMVATCSTRDYTWSDGRLRYLWKQWLRSPLRHAGALALSLNIARSRMLLNRYFTEARRPEYLVEVQNYVKTTRRLHPDLAGFMDRFAARIALATDDRKRAFSLLQSSHHNHTSRGLMTEAERDAVAIGALTEGAEGKAMRDSALERLRALGMADPLADLATFYPELVEP